MRRRIASAVASAGASQAFWYLSLPLVTRLYGQEGMGLYGQFLTYTGIVSLVVGARADLAILTSTKNQLQTARIAFLKLSFILATLLFAGSGVLLALNPNKLDSLLVWTALLGGFLASRFMVEGAALIKLGESTPLLGSALLRSTVQTVSQCALFALGPLGLVVGRIVGDASGVWARTFALRRTRGGRKRNLRLRFTKRERISLRRNSNAYKFSFPQTVINAASQGLPLLILPGIVALEWLGRYALAFTVIVAPLGLIATPLRQVLIAKFSEGAAKAELGEVKASVVKWMLAMAAMAVTGALVLHVVAGPAVTLIFGEDWAGTEDLIKILWWWAGSGLVLTPALALLLAMGKNRDHLVSELAVLLGRVVALAVGASSFAGNAVIIPFVLWSSLANVALALWMLRRARCSGQK